TRRGRSMTEGIHPDPPPSSSDGPGASRPQSLQEVVQASFAEDVARLNEKRRYVAEKRTLGGFLREVIRDLFDVLAAVFLTAAGVAALFVLRRCLDWLHGRG